MNRILTLGLVVIILAVVSVAGCANLMPTQQRALTGGAIGMAAAGQPLAPWQAAPPWGLLWAGPRG